MKLSTIYERLASNLWPFSSLPTRIARRHGMSALWFLKTPVFVALPFSFGTLWTFNKRTCEKRVNWEFFIQSSIQRNSSCENWCCHESFPKKIRLFTFHFMSVFSISHFSNDDYDAFISERISMKTLENSLRYFLALEGYCAKKLSRIHFHQDFHQ